MDGKKNNGWVRDLRHACASTLKPPVSCSNVHGVFPVHKFSWFCLVQVFTTQFCCFSFLLLSTIEGVNWVCEEILERHARVSGLTIFMQTNESLVTLKFEIDVPCVIEWRLLWLSSLARPNQRFLHNDTIFAKQH